LIFDEVVVDITADGGAYLVSLEDRVYRLYLRDTAGGRLELLIDGRPAAAYVSSDARYNWVTIAGRTYLLTKSAAASSPAATHAGSSELTAPMPGQVRMVNVKAGDAVHKGQVLVVLEAMKMEIRLQAPFDGLVAAVAASVGQTVEREHIIIRLEKG
jgi:biotin carboxyl carrier protein